MKQIILRGRHYFINKDDLKALAESIHATKSNQAALAEHFDDVQDALYGHVDDHEKLKSAVMSSVATAVSNGFVELNCQTERLAAAIDKVYETADIFQKQSSIELQGTSGLNKGLSDFLDAMRNLQKNMKETDSGLSGASVKLTESIANIPNIVSSAVKAGTESFSKIVIEGYRQKMQEMSNEIAKIRENAASVATVWEEKAGKLDSTVQRLNNIDSLAKMLESREKELGESRQKRLEQHKAIESLNKQIMELQKSKDDLKGLLGEKDAEIGRLNEQLQGLLDTIRKPVENEPASNKPSENDRNYLISKFNSLNDREKRVFTRLVDGRGVTHVAELLGIDKSQVSRDKKHMVELGLVNEDDGRIVSNVDINRLRELRLL